MSDSGNSSAPITLLLAKAREGDRAALNELLPAVYKELHGLAASAARRSGQATLQPTALVHEAYLKMFAGQPAAFADRAHFLATAARVMRQVLVDYARARGAQKRGLHRPVPLEVDMAAVGPHGSVLELDQALDRLEKEDTRLVRLIEMRFFAGMTAEETAEARAESVHVVRHDLRYAQTRLRRMMAR